MPNELVFRYIFLLVFVGMFLISGYFRRSARQSGEAIRRDREGRGVLAARVLGATVLYLPFVAYGLQPALMEWSSIQAPLPIRWLASVVGVAMLPVLAWVMISIGKNVSETYLTKESHKLVTAGPYRWVRHPLYTVAAIALISLSIVASNWLMLAVAFCAPIAIGLFVVPREETELIRRFGDEYREYQARTGMFVPQILR
jgi:protein-S-isoprenylcysteine O-methyltransferase Ste14